MRHEDLTIEKLEELTGKTYSHEEAEEIVFAIKQFASIQVSIGERREIKNEQF
jgi:hypothetical protein